MPGGPRPPRSYLDRAQSPTAPTAMDLEAMRAAAWHRHGVAALAVEDIADPWLRQAVINEARRRWGPRNGGQRHGR
ncbi:hypothetical protein DFH01_20715 [Falsiroseomonas bella]|uniref:Uncharacterized protein n=2 Tax=Falsiroseomonas bella TaxID=2184016 RepID=A0A317FEG6_9PROT|nr:hypothetical protein DFH01_20715 [Falsiroseomonas bella]